MTLKIFALACALFCLQGIQSFKVQRSESGITYIALQVSRESRIVYPILSPEMQANAPDVVYLSNNFTIEDNLGTSTLLCPQNYTLLSGACTFNSVRQGDNNFLKGSNAEKNSYTCQYNTGPTTIQNDLQVSISCSKLETVIVTQQYQNVYIAEVSAECPEGYKVSGGSCQANYKFRGVNIAGTFAEPKKFECAIQSTEETSFNISAICVKADIDYKFPFQANQEWYGGNTTSSQNACGLGTYYPIGGNCEKTSSEIFGSKIGQQSFECLGKDFSSEVTQVICLNFGQ